jgi:hypothetical protein
MKGFNINFRLCLVLAGLTTVHIYAQDQCATSVLGGINCGGAQATCFQQVTATSGAVRCTCTANCLSPQSSTMTVAATRSLEWGFNNGPCHSQLTGTATGGTTPTTTSTSTAVFARVTVSGIQLSTSNSSRQVVDCFNGTVQNEPTIFGLC